MAASNDVADRMLAMLVRERVVSPQQQGEVEKIIDATGRKVGAVLVDMGLLRSDELLPAGAPPLRKHRPDAVWLDHRTLADGTRDDSRT